MMFSPEKIQGLIEVGLPGAKAIARDTTGTSDHFELVVVSSSFTGKGMVERHRMVYGVLGAAVGAEIHALSLKTYTPEEAEKRG